MVELSGSFFLLYSYVRSFYFFLFDRSFSFHICLLDVVVFIFHLCNLIRVEHIYSYWVEIKQTALHTNDALGTSSYTDTYTRARIQQATNEMTWKWELLWAIEMYKAQFKCTWNEFSVKLAVCWLVPWSHYSIRKYHRKSHIPSERKRERDWAKCNTAAGHFHLKITTHFIRSI